MLLQFLPSMALEEPANAENGEFGKDVFDVLVYVVSLRAVVMEPNQLVSVLFAADFTPW